MSASPLGSLVNALPVINTVQRRGESTSEVSDTAPAAGEFPYEHFEDGFSPHFR